MPVSFSYLNFPNLWDDILADTTDFRTLRSLRQVSKSLRDVIDRRAARHLAIEHGGCRDVDVFAFEYPLPSLTSLCPATLDEDRTSKPAIALTEHTRVLDIRGYVVPIVDMTKLAPLFPNLETVRVTTGLIYHDTYTPYIPLEAKKLVLFMNPQGMSGIFNHWWYERGDDEHADTLESADLSPEAKEWASGGPKDDDNHRDRDGDSGEVEDDEEHDDEFDEYSDFDFEEWHENYQNRSRPLAPEGAAPHSLPESYRKIVVNMNGLDEPITPMFPYVLDPEEHVEEVVIIVPQFTSADSPGTIQPKVPGMRNRWFKMHIMDVLSGANDSTTKYTIVGLDRVDAEAEQDFKDTLYNQVTTTLYTDVDYTLDDAITLAMPAQARRHAVLNVEQARHLRLEFPGDDVGAGEGGEEAEPGAGAAAVHEALAALQARGGAAQLADQPVGDRGGHIRIRYSPTPRDGHEPRVSLQQKVDGILARIETLSMDAYRARVGAEAAALETVEYARPADYELLARKRKNGFRGMSPYVDGEGVLHESAEAAMNAHIETTPEL